MSYLKKVNLKLSEEDNQNIFRDIFIYGTGYIKVTIDSSETLQLAYISREDFLKENINDPT